MRSACLSVCLSVCLFVYLSARIPQKPESIFHQILRTCGSVVILYIMHFRFCGWRHVFTQWSQWALNKDLYVSSSSPGGSTEAEVCHLRLHLVLWLGSVPQNSRFCILVLLTEATLLRISERYSVLFTKPCPVLSNMKIVLTFRRP